jgi:hypothetical protein
MKQQQPKIYKVGRTIYCILVSSSHPNTLIPVRGVVKEVKWERQNPSYLIKITGFYDTFYYIKQNFFDMTFFRDIDKKIRASRIRDEDFKSLEEIVARFDKQDENRFYVHVDSVMTSPTKKNLEELFSDVVFFLISRWFSEIKTNATRPFYKGCFKLGSQKEFNRNLSIAFGDLIKRGGIDPRAWLDSI